MTSLAKIWALGTGRATYAEVMGTDSAAPDAETQDLAPFPHTAEESPVTPEAPLDQGPEPESEDLDEELNEIGDLSDLYDMHDEGNAEANDAEILSFHPNDEENWLDSNDTGPAERNSDWLMPAAFTAVLGGWTAFFISANFAAMQTAVSAQALIAWITTWATPVMLLIGIWLILRTRPSVKAQQFRELSQNFITSTDELERRLTTVNRELSIAREFLSAQTLEMESFGRQAAERISANATELQQMVVLNTAQIDAIAAVSETALRNMTSLRDDLPVIANAARDVSNQFGNAGNTANAQIDSMIAGFQRINEFGTASGKLITQTESKMVKTLHGLEEQAKTVESFVNARAEAMARRAHELQAAIENKEKSSHEHWQKRVDEMKSVLTNAITELQRIDSEALAATQRKLAELDDNANIFEENIRVRDINLQNHITSRLKIIAAAEEEALAKLNAQFTQFDEAVDLRKDVHEQLSQKLQSANGTIAEQLAALRSEFALLSQEGEKSQSKLAENSALIASQIEESHAKLTAIDSNMAGLTDASVRLLELIQGSAVNAREALPGALEEAEKRLSLIKNDTEGFLASFAEAGNKGDILAQALTAMHGTNREAIAEVDALYARIAETQKLHEEKIAAIREGMEALDTKGDAIAEKSAAVIAEALAALEKLVTTAPEQIEDSVRQNIMALTNLVGEEAAKAIEMRVADNVTQSLIRLEEASQKASSVGAAAATSITKQVEHVHALAADIEQRVERAKDSTEELANNDFARRVSQITEALNSNAVDLSEALSNEVSDDDWQTYLRGDRGVFTRKALRLLDNAKAREIADILSNDDDFRQNVSRYIHDFEAMLRSVLTTRDGNTLSVTLLSSEVGKLYVALAQSIERIKK